MFEQSFGFWLYWKGELSANVSFRLDDQCCFHTTANANNNFIATIIQLYVQVASITFSPQRYRDHLHAADPLHSNTPTKSTQPSMS